MSDPSSGTIGWSFLRSKRWLGYFAMLLVFSIACVWLGNWQFERRAEARAEIARLDANYGAPAVDLADEVPELEKFDENVQKWRTAVVEGEYLGDPFLARNRPGPAGVGSDLIQPMRTSEGAVFFVNRGWVPVDGNDADSGAIQADELPQPPDGIVEVEVRLRAGEPEVPGRTSSGSTVASIDLPELARLTDTVGNAYTGAYGMLVSESPEGAHGTLPPKPERDEGPHLSYALQWYVFILIAAIGVGFAARQEYRGLNAGSSTVRAQDQRRDERKTRRGPSDADVEDAMLDA